MIHSLFCVSISDSNLPTIPIHLTAPESSQIVYQLTAYRTFRVFSETISEAYHYAIAFGTDRAPYAYTRFACRHRDVTASRR